MPDFNLDCSVEGCERESVDKSGLCKKHKSAATSEPQEWTVEWLINKIGWSQTNSAPFREVCDAHNAALTALNEECNRYVRQLAKAHKQLAAERDKRKPLVEALRTNATMRHVEQHAQYGDFETCPVVNCRDARAALAKVKEGK
jgi:hypothetical protein